MATLGKIVPIFLFIVVLAGAAYGIYGLATGAISL